jgi:hypothetical protein
MTEHHNNSIFPKQRVQECARERFENGSIPVILDTIAYGIRHS